MTTVLLVRHGETTWNRDRRIQGWAPSSLTDRGREQAREMAGYVADRYDVDRIVSSDLRRTRETTRLLRGVVPVPVTFDRAWRERHFGVLQGLSYEALFDGHPEFALSEVGIEAAHATPEGGESLLDLQSRILDAWEALLADDDGETVVVVAHGGPIRLLRGHLEGVDVPTAMLEYDMDNCSVTEVAVDDGGERVVSANRRPWLDDGPARRVADDE